MNNVFTAKLLQNLNNKKGEKGFTLIELLVVVIIIGVLAAVALPNLLGQVGKARESEAKSAMGALNRAQQGYHLEARAFYGGGAVDGSDTWADTETALGVVPGKEFYVYSNISPTAAGATDTQSEMIAVAVDPNNDGARDFATGMTYNAGAFTSTLCVAQNKAAVAGPRTTAAAITATLLADVDVANNDCDAGNIIE
ncbi:MAG: type II secretion system protein [Pleurocapsa sp. MO_226.B13]|nr:type II secretion system protein [Pleurocapsa sp. MO_226.B13]